MLIVCPSCASEYALDPERIGDRGRKVRCAVCRTTWVVHKPEGSEAETGWAPGQDGATTQGAPTIEGSEPPANPGMPAQGPMRRRRSEPRPDRTRERLAMAAIALVLIATPSAIAFRKDVVRHIPGSARLFSAVGLGVNIVGLELADVTAGIAEEGSVRALMIEGEIRSVASRPVAVPRLEFAIEAPDRQSLYRWSVKPPVIELNPGESARFTTRLPSPPPDGARLVASFQSASGDQSVALR